MGTVGSNPPDQESLGPAGGRGKIPGLTPRQCQVMAGFLQGMANPVRVEIICSLRDGEKNVGDIARRVGGNRSNISRQLQILTAKGYVTRRREERNMFYRVPEPAIHEFMAEVFRLVRRREDQGPEPAGLPCERRPNCDQ